MTARLNLRLDPEIAGMDRRRGHRFQPPVAVLRKIPGLYGTEQVDVADKMVHVHYFVGGWDWYVVELDPETWEAFALVRSPACPDGEWGYVDLTDLAAMRGPVVMMLAAEGGSQASFRQPVERDCWWEPIRVWAIR